MEQRLIEGPFIASDTRFTPEANVNVSFSMFQALEPNQDKKIKVRRGRGGGSLTPVPLGLSQQRSPFSLPRWVL